MLHAKNLLLLLTIHATLLVPGVCYAQELDIETSITAVKNLPYPQGKVINEGYFNDSTPVYRVFQGVNPDGYWIVQDFYLEGKKPLTNPFLQKPKYIPQATPDEPVPIDPLAIRVKRYGAFEYRMGMTYEEGIFIEGPLTVWSADGKKLLEAYYKEGKLHGTWTQWYDSGAIYQTVEYADGVFATPLISYYENGQVSEEAFYSAGYCRSGLWRFWHKNGQLASEKLFENGELQGVDKGWYPNGQLAYEGMMNGWKKMGLYTTWYENGQKKSEQEYLAGELSGKSTTWTEDGQLIDQGSYLADRKEGLWISWHSNGKEESQGYYRDGYKVGQWQFWDTEGNLVDEGSYPPPTLKLEDTKKAIVSTGYISYGENQSVNTYRKFLKLTPEGYYLVQDFYEQNHKPFSEPFVLLRQKDVKEQLTPDYYTLEKLSITGKLTLRYPDGKVWATAHFKNGKMHGDLDIWDTDGKQTLKLTYVDGFVSKVQKAHR